MGGLKLHLLGPFEATLDDAPLAGLRSNKGRALLAYLASRPGFPHQRETLATLLWGEVSEEAARLSLRVALSHLRNALAPVFLAPGLPPLLETTRHHVQLNATPELCRIDAAEFDALLAACTAHSDAHASAAHCPTCMERLAEMAALYRGDFLADLTFSDSPAFDEWRVVQQERYHRQALTALDQVTQHYLACGDYVKAQQAARRQVELEPWREQAHRQLMQCLALDGQRNAALAQYETARRILARELGAEPEAETNMLYAQILAGSTLSEARTPPAQQRIALPAPLTPFIGREQELQRIGELLGEPACRLLTLLGPSGIGKTRLAQEAANRFGSTFAQGVCYVSLEFNSAADVLSIALAEALHLPLAQSDAPSLAPLSLYLRDRAMLLVLDDCVPGPQVATWIVNLLRSALAVKILAICPQRLNVRGEWLLRVHGLTYLAPCDTSLQLEGEMATENDAQTCSAVQLFVESARRITPHFELSTDCLSDVLQICRLVEGMPLALELAAAWTPILSCREIVAEIRNNLDFLATTLEEVPPRQRNLRVVFQRTWDLLSADERTAFARLAVFPGDFDRVAAEAVAGTPLSVLAMLTDKSLLRRMEPNNGRREIRFSLHNVLRQYALKELADMPAEPSATIERHATYYLEFLVQHGAELEGPQQQAALVAIAGEIDNVRMAWEWALANSQIDTLANAWSALFTFYNVRSWFREGDAAFARLVAALDNRPDTSTDAAQVLKGMALAGQGWFSYQLAQYDQADELMRQSMLILCQQNAPDALAFGLSRRGAIALHMGAYAEARRDCLDSLDLFQAFDDQVGMAMVFGFLGQLALEEGHFEEAEERCLASLELARSLGNRWRIAFPLTHLARVAIARGDFERGQALLNEALAIRRERQDQRGVATTYLYFGDLELARGDCASAQQRYGQALAVFLRLGHRQGVARSLVKVADVLVQAGQTTQGMLLFTLLYDRSEAQERALTNGEELYRAAFRQLPSAMASAVREQARTTTLEVEAQRYAVQVE